MIARAVLMVVLAWSVAFAAAQSPQSCPWLNAGTAAKALGVEVTATAHVDSNWSGSCHFAAQSTPPREIGIEVSKTAARPCGSKAITALGIGNEASLCSLRGEDGQTVQVLAGRVRNVWFVVRMTMPASTSRAPQSEAEAADFSRIKFLGEQVAGNLY